KGGDCKLPKMYGAVVLVSADVNVMPDVGDTESSAENPVIWKGMLPVESLLVRSTSKDPVPPAGAVEFSTSRLRPARHGLAPAVMTVTARARTRGRREPPWR